MFNTNNNVKTDDLPATEVNMLPGLLANNDKLVSTSKRWNYDSANKDELLDEDVDDIINNNNNKYDSYTETGRTKDNGNDSESDDDYSKHRNTNNDNNNTSESDDKQEAKLSPEELLLKKLDMLRKLGELAQAGVKLSQNYTMRSDMKLMEYEYELHKNIRAKQQAINWMSSMTLNCIYGLEMLNKKYDPFELKLTGWHEQMNADMNTYYDVFGDLYEKYSQPGKGMAPELRFLLMVSGSAMKYHLSHTVINGLPSLNDEMDAHPELAERLRNQAINDRISKTNHEQREKIQEMMNKEHENVNQRAIDLHMIKDKELEYLNAEKLNARKEAQLNDLRTGLKINNPQNQSQNNHNIQPPKIPDNLRSTILGDRLNQINNSNRQYGPVTYADLEQKRIYEKNIREQHLLEQELADKRRKVMHQQQAIKEMHIKELQNLKNIQDQMKREYAKSQSETYDNDSVVSRSSVTMNPEIENILGVNLKNKNMLGVTPIETIERDEVSKSQISLGSRKSKNSCVRKSQNNELKK